jgi:cytochrome b involved in lipid metabolism
MNLKIRIALFYFTPTHTPLPYRNITFNNLPQQIGGPKVYDVTKYLDDHPGGAEVMLDVAGQDADEFFEDIGHSKDAREELKQYYIGDFKMDAAQIERMRLAAEASANAKGAGSTTGFMVILVVIIAMALGYYQTQMSKVAA